MNLRTLKKLSKRAAPMLPTLGDRRMQFRAEKCGSYMSAAIFDRKHWERSPVHPTYATRNDYQSPRGAEIVIRTRVGRPVRLAPPSHPRKGTVMVGAMSGYYEPEWDEETAFEALSQIVFAHFTDWSAETPLPTRQIRTARDVFAAAREIIREDGSVAA